MSKARGKREAMGLATAASLNAPWSKHYKVPESSIPKSWEKRAVQAWKYYLEEPIINNAINAWRVLALGNEVRILHPDQSVRDEAERLSRRLRLTKFLRDMILQLLVKGDCVGFKEPGEGGEPEELLCLNPVFCVPKYEDGRLVEMRQRESLNAADTGEPIEPVEQVIHLKWNAPAFAEHGNSMILPAFESIELLRDYRRAERAIAKRWTMPLRFVKVGGVYGSKVIMPDQKMIDEITEKIDSMDLRSGLVVPFYVEAKTYGTEGEVLDTERKVKEVKEDIMVALGFSRTLITGDGPNFATAQVSLTKVSHMLSEATIITSAKL